MACHLSCFACQLGRCCNRSGVLYLSPSFLLNRAPATERERKATISQHPVKSGEPEEISSNYGYPSIAGGSMTLTCLGGYQTQLFRLIASSYETLSCSSASHYQASKSALLWAKEGRPSAQEMPNSS